MNRLTVLFVLLSLHLIQTNGQVSSWSSSWSNNEATTLDDPSQEGDLRLRGGSSPANGRIEIYHNDQWGTICDDGWGSYDARVACSQLGFTGSGASARCCATYGYGLDPVWLTYVGCLSSQAINDDALLVDCGSYGVSWGPVSSCGHYEDAGVSCNTPTNKVRLHVPQHDPDNDGMEGRVEIFVNGRWGSICADEWDIKDANIFCQQLGFTDAERAYNGSYRLEHGTQGNHVLPVMGNVDCVGTEAYLAECEHGGWGFFASNGNYQDCDSGAAWAKCRLVFGADEIRLSGGTAAVGRVEVYYDGEWGTICHDHWGVEEGEVACRQLGFPGVSQITTGSSFGPSRNTRMWLDDMECTGDEENLALCKHDGWGYVGSCDNTREAGVGCLLTHDGDIRLRGGSSNSEGRLEVFHNGQWGTICDIGWDVRDADVICRHLGYKSSNGTGVFGRDSAPSTIWLSNITCAGNESDLSACGNGGWEETDLCSHDNDVGLSCIEASNKLRLGDTNREGLVEIFHNGRWGTICIDGWDVNEVRVVCKYLGFSGDGSVQNTGSSSISPVWLGNLTCTGSENNIAECGHPGWDVNQGCNYAEQAGVVCHVAKEGDIRLVSNDSADYTAQLIQTSGRVEIFHGGEWGTVCDRGWDIYDATVVCRQLGFSKAIERVEGPTSMFTCKELPDVLIPWGWVCNGHPDCPDNTDEQNCEAADLNDDRVFLSDVDCTGSESSILKCDYRGWGNVDCHAGSAVVECVDIDTSPPVIYDCPRSINVSVKTGSVSQPVFWLEPLAMDDTGITTLLTSSHAPGATFHEGKTIVSYLFVNPANLIAACSFEVNGIPVGLPYATNSTNQPLPGYQPTVIDCPQDTTIDVEFGTQGTAVIWNEPRIDSPVGDGALLVKTHTSGDMFTNGKTTVIYFFTAVSQLMTCSFNVIGTLVDTKAPLIYQCPFDVLEFASHGSIASVSWLEPFAIDASGYVRVQQSHWPGMAFQSGVTPVTYNFTDESGNVAWCDFNVTVLQDIDTRFPPQGLLNITYCPDTINVNIEMGTLAMPVNWTEPTVNNEGATVSLVSRSHVSGDPFLVGRTQVEYIFADDRGRVARCVFEVVGNLVDTTPPTIYMCPIDQYVQIELGENTATIDWIEPFAIDISGATRTNRSHSPTATFTMGLTPVLYQFMDGYGNRNKCDFDIFVVVADTKPPIVSNCPGYISATREIDTPLPLVTWDEPTAHDLSGIANVTSTHTPGTTPFNVGSTFVTYTFVDISNNEAICKFHVDVKEVDTRPPTITNCPRDISLTMELGTPGFPVSWTEPSATDLSGTADIDLQSHKPGVIFPSGKSIVTYVFSDASPNFAMCSFTVDIITVDTTPPMIIQCPNNIYAGVPQNRTNKIIFWIEPSAYDVSGNVTVGNTGWNPGDGFPTGTTAVHYNFTDPSGNSATCTFDVVITEPPVIQNCPGDIRKNVELGKSYRGATWTEPSIDPREGTLMMNTHSPGSKFPVGRTGVSYVFHDYEGHISTCTFIVTIRDDDRLPPDILQCPPDIERIATSHSAGTAVTWTEPTALDHTNITRTRSHTPGSTFRAGTTMVTYNFTDTSGNQAVCSFRITIDPVSTIFFEVTACPSDIIKSLEVGTNRAIPITWREPKVVDPHGTVSVKSQSHQSGNLFEVGETAVIYELVNEAGHVETCSFKVIINSVDTTPPVISGCPRDMTVEMELGMRGKSIHWVEPTATDLSLKTNLLFRSHIPDALFYPGQSLVSYIFVDASNNFASCTFHINTRSVDTSPPIVTACPTNITKLVEDGIQSTPVTFNPPQAIDMSGDVPVVIGSHNSGGNFSIGTTVVTYEFRDSAHNSATCIFEVTVAAPAATFSKQTEPMTSESPISIAGLVVAGMLAILLLLCLLVFCLKRRERSIKHSQFVDDFNPGNSHQDSSGKASFTFNDTDQTSDTTI